MAGMLVVTVDRSRQARRSASRFLLEVSPGVFSGVVSRRVREGLLEALAADVAQYTAVWSEGGRVRFVYQGAREDGRSAALYDGIPLVEIPDSTARGRLFRKRVTQLDSKEGDL